MLNQFFLDTVALFVIVDPIGTATIFAGLTKGEAAEKRRRLALRGTALASLMIAFFAFGGEFLLTALGISLPAFQFAGGVLLFLLAIDMVFARNSGFRATTTDEAEEAKSSQDISVFPLAIPLIAGPGALTSIVLLMQQAGQDFTRSMLVLLALFVVMLATLLALWSAALLIRILGVTGTNVISRVLGVILSAFAAELVLKGMRSGLFV
jgi:multiple antibiotic resistance protein